MVVRIGVVVAAAVIVLALSYLFLAGSPVTADSSVLPPVAIDCEGSTGVGVDECRAWGDAILAKGAPSFTFEMDDLARLTLTRPMFGLASTCEANWFLGRFPDDAVWTEAVACGSE